MFKKVNFVFNGSEDTGYGQHAKFFWEELKKLVPTEGNDEPQCTIVLSTCDSPDFYKNYEGYKIAFCVWESTLFPDKFFKKLLEFDQLWVPSEWARVCAIGQGYPENRVKVVPEGVDGTVYKYVDTSKNATFNFLHVGKWEDRKSTKEIIETWIKTFPEEYYPGFRLYLLVDTNFSVDGMSSTKERLKHYGFDDNRLIDLPFQSKEYYINLLQSTNIFITCARAEGWNLPLIEAIACGIPSICSQYGAQLDFHNFPELQVKITEHRKPVNVYNMPDCPGTWAEPDYEDLSKVLLYTYQNYDELKNKFVNNSNTFIKKWAWENAAKIAKKELDLLSEKERISIPLTFNYHFVKGAFIAIKGDNPNSFKVIFTDNDTGREIHSAVVKSKTWVKTCTEYFRDVTITVVEVETNKVVFRHSYDATDKRVFVNFDSNSLGDQLAWIPYCDEFRKKHNCKMIVSTWKNFLFEKVYPEIEFVKPGTTVPNLYAQYSIGVYHENREWKHPRDWRAVPLQRVASDILGLEYKEIKPRIDTSNVYIAKIKRPSRYVCISEFSTAQCKYWNNPNGWQQLVDKLNTDGYNVVVISKEKTTLKNVIDVTNNHIDITIGILLGCEFYIGLASGLAWLAWALGKKVVMISGFSEPFEEFTSNNIRINGIGDCTGCLNDIFIPNRAWDEGCFHNKDFSCTKNLTADMVYERLPIIKKPKILDFTTAPILRNSKRQTTFKKYLEEIHKFSGVLHYGEANLIEIGIVRKLSNDPDLPADGNSTAIFAWYVKNFSGHLTAVDISPISISNCKLNLENQNLMSPNIQIIEQDGLEFLRNYNKVINGIYIDALDYDNKEGHGKENSAKFHLEAFKLSEPNLVSGSMIMFDDVIGPNYEGKAKLVIPYALSTGKYEILYQNYQIILRKH